MQSSVLYKVLTKELKQLEEDPVEGLLCVPNAHNIAEWQVYIDGPPDTPFEKGIFELKMTFPADYPMKPPELVFVSEFYHPNVYPDGKVCISTLHEPGEDALGYESADERWRPTHNATSVVLSVLSMLGDPNFSSPANVDASVDWRQDFSGYKARISRLIDLANKRNGHIEIPHPESDPQQRAKLLEKRRLANDAMDYYDDFDEEDFLDMEGSFGEWSDGDVDAEWSDEDEDINKEDVNDDAEDAVVERKSSKKPSKEPKVIDNKGDRKVSKEKEHKRKHKHRSSKSHKTRKPKEKKRSKHSEKHENTQKKKRKSKKERKPLMRRIS